MSHATETSSQQPFEPDVRPRTARDTLMLVLLAGTALVLMATILGDILRGLLR
jgi:hypothetical protein